MKKYVLIIIAVIILIIGFGILGGVRARGQDATALENLETEPIKQGDLEITVGANGVARSHQSAQLLWKTQGTVSEVKVEVGDQVADGDILASLERTSLPQSVILAQADLVEAQRALDDLLNSRSQQAQARKAVEKAKQALEDALNPELTQALAIEAIAAAQKTVEEAQRTLNIMVNPVSQSAKDQAYATLLLAENALENTRDQIELVERKLKKDESQYNFWESKDLYQDILENLERKLVKDQRAYEDALQRYNNLLKPPDPDDLALAEAAVALAQAQLAYSEREYNRIKDGNSPADIAVLEAQLADAEREWERLQNGPDPDEIAAAEARIAAARAILSQADVTAPFNGEVTQVAVNPGDPVSPDNLAFRLDDLSRIFVDTQVSEVDINRIQLGQTALLTFESIPAKEYRGKVAEVLSVGEIVEGVTFFTVHIEISDPDRQIKPGMTSSVTFVVDELSDTLLVPNRSLRMLDGKRVVFVKQGSNLFPIEVNLGLASETYSQVLEGDLKLGDLVVLNPPDAGERPGLGSRLLINR